MSAMPHVTAARASNRDGHLTNRQTGPTGAHRKSWADQRSSQTHISDHQQNHPFSAAPNEATELSGRVVTDTTTEAAKPNRAQRRRMKTREKLIGAGRELFAKRGVDATTIEDITETADVGRGSFYNFFDTKESLVEAIVADLIDGLARMESAIEMEFDDPLTALAITLRSALHIITTDEVLAWFIVRTQTISGAVSDIFLAATSALIQRGIERGQFKVKDPDVATILLGGGFLAVLEMALLRRIPPEATDEVIEQLIRGLGVTPAALRKVASLQPSLDRFTQAVEGGRS